MLEQHRIEYLQAMGIQLWMPREVLPNAPEPRWLAENPAQAGSVAAPDAVKGGHAADLLAGMGLAAVEAPAAKQSQPTESINQVAELPSTAASNSSAQIAEPSAQLSTEQAVDMTVPHFELGFVLWPCGTLWVSTVSAEPAWLAYQASVSSFITGSNYRQHSLFSFKWPYLEISSEDQSKPVALRALHAQWDHIKSQGSKQWVAMDEQSKHWFEQVAGEPLLAVDSADQLFIAANKKALWQALVK